MNWIKKNAPTILSVVASVGVVATFILTARKADKVSAELEELEEPSKKDELKIYAKEYAPAIATGLATIVCIIFSNKLNKKQQVSLMGAYTLAYQQYDRYKNKVKELYGKEAHEEIIKALAAEKAVAPDIYADGGIVNMGDRKIRDRQASMLFYDRYSDRYFESTMESVLDAEYHLNRNYVLRGYVTLNEFYIFLGIDTIKEGGQMGWDSGEEFDGIWWLDFNHYLTDVQVTDDQTVECIVVDIAFDPALLDFNADMMP